MRWKLLNSPLTTASVSAKNAVQENALPVRRWQSRHAQAWTPTRRRRHRHGQRAAGAGRSLAIGRMGWFGHACLLHSRFADARCNVECRKESVSRMWCSASAVHR